MTAGNWKRARTASERNYSALREINSVSNCAEESSSRPRRPSPLVRLCTRLNFAAVTCGGFSLLLNVGALKRFCVQYRSMFVIETFHKCTQPSMSPMTNYYIIFILLFARQSSTFTQDACNSSINLLNAWVLFNLQHSGYTGRCEGKACCRKTQ